MNTKTGNLQPVPPSLENQLVQLQWVSSVLKSLEATWNKDQALLSIQDPLVSSLLEGLGSASPSHVTSSCMVLMSACTRHGWLGHQELLAGLVAQAVTAPVYPLLVDAVSRLLLQEMDAIVESCSVYISPYSLRVNIHPFISIINSRPEAGMVVVYHVMQILRVRRLSQSSVLLVEPVVKHLFLHPSPPPSFTCLVTQLYSDLTHLATGNSDVSQHLTELLVRVLPLHPTNTPSQLLSVASFSQHLLLLHSSLTPLAREGITNLCFHFTMELTKRSLPVLPLLDSITSLLHRHTELVRDHHVLVLAWLLLHHLPSSHTISSLLTLGADLCKLLPHHLSAILVLPLVQLLSQPSSALQQLDSIHSLPVNHCAARSLLDHIQEACLAGRQATVLAASSMAGVVHGNLSHMASVVQQYMRVQAEPMLVGGWLEATPLGSADSAELVTLLAAALAMCFADKADILKPVLLSFRRLAKAIPNLTPSILPFLLHLQNSIPDSQSKLVLLNSIPNLATHAVSAVSVLSILHILATDSALLPLATYLIGKAWQLQDQLYPNVREVLTRPLPTPTLSAAQVRAIEVARAVVMRDVCCTRAEQHGEQMLSLISRTLTSSYRDTLQVAMALEGVVSLCQHEVVDVVTVWGVLGKRLTSDLRPGVQVALCSLFALAAELHSDTSHSQKVFRSTALQFLWEKVFSQTALVCAAALKALTNFKIEDFSLSHFPRQAESHDSGPSGSHDSGPSGSHDSGPSGSHDSGPALPLVGSQCVQILHYIPEGALDAYSAFLVSLVGEELSGMSRGVVYSAMKHAALASTQEAGLRARADLLRAQQFNESELTSGYVQYAALTGVMDSGPADLQVAKRWELRTALDRKLAVLRQLFGNCSGPLLRVGGVALWEGLAAMYASKRWEVLKDVCQLFYQIRLLAVNSDLSSVLPRQQQQAHDWALEQVLDVLKQSISDNASSAPCVFMAAVGVATYEGGTCGRSFKMEEEPVSVRESLLLDLLNASLSQQQRGGHMTFTHGVIAAILKAESSQLEEARLLSLPMLFRAVTSHWGTTYPHVVREKLVCLVSGLFQSFNRAPNWHSAIVLSQVFVSPPCGELSDLFSQLLPFLEASTQGSNEQLLCLAAPFVPALLSWQNHTLATSMLSALQQQLTSEVDLSSHPTQLCALHLATGIRDGYAVGLLSPEAAMTGVSLLADLATRAPGEAALLLAVGVVLHGLSGCGHVGAHSLAESVGGKWLQELDTLTGSTEVVAVMLGLAGLVGVEPVRGVAWESRFGTAQHVEMTSTLAYLVVDKMEKLSTSEDSVVWSLSVWLAGQVAVDVAEMLAQRERVPPDYHYLPSSSTLTSVFDTCGTILSQPLTQHTRPVLLALLRVLNQQSGLPPVDYSSLFLPALLVKEGCGPQLQAACLKCLASTRGQGFKHLLLYCTLPHVFPFLQSDCVTMLLGSFPVCVCALHSSARLDGFLREVGVSISSYLIHRQHMLEVYLTGLQQAVEGAGLQQAIEGVGLQQAAEGAGLQQAAVGEGLEELPVRRSLCTGVQVLYSGVCASIQELAQDTSCTPRDLHSLLQHSSLWRAMGECVNTVPMDIALSKSQCGHGQDYVVVVVLCSLVVAGLKSFQHLTHVLEWSLDQLAALDQDVRARSIFFSPFQSLLQTVHFCCSSKCKESLLNQTELLHMLSGWTRAHPECQVTQWSAVLLLVITGVCQRSHDCGAGVGDLNSQLDLLLAGLEMSVLPTSPLVREKLMECLLEWLGATNHNLIRATILGYFSTLKSCDEYKKNTVWSTVAHLI